MAFSIALAFRNRSWRDRSRRRPDPRRLGGALLLLLALAAPAGAQVGFDRPGGDYRNFEIPTDPVGRACGAACQADARCRAWTYSRPGYYGGHAARCFLKDRVTLPRHEPCCISGVVR